MSLGYYHGRPRHIVVDGSNVAYAHGGHKIFSCKGLQLCVDYFRGLGHPVTILVPEPRRWVPQIKSKPISDQPVMEKLLAEGYLEFTPPKVYDDRLILQKALDTYGLVVSNDRYRELVDERRDWQPLISNGVLRYAFSGDKFKVLKKR